MNKLVILGRATTDTREVNVDGTDPDGECLFQGSLHISYYDGSTPCQG